MFDLSMIIKYEMDFSRWIVIGEIKEIGFEIIKVFLKIKFGFLEIGEIVLFDELCSYMLLVERIIILEEKCNIFFIFKMILKN